MVLLLEATTVRPLKMPPEDDDDEPLLVTSAADMWPRMT